VTEDHTLAAISEPDFDINAIVVPDEGPMVFEFDLEVRPEFDLPNWKGLSVERPVKEFNDADVDTQLQKILAQRGRLVPHDGPASAGDYIATKITFKHGDEVLSSSDDEVLRIRPTLSFRDGKIEKFDKLMKGVKAGETREAEATLTEDAPNAALRGKKVKAIFEVLEVKKLELPELTPELLSDLGDFDSEEALRGAIRESLARQLSYQQQQRARQQVLSVLTEAANWELPPDLLQRQSARELQRSVLELRRSGFSDEQIRAHENELRQNSRAATAKALKEHFVLERIAEEEAIDDTPDDYEKEIALIAAQTGESVRRTRAQLEKGGLMDTLRNQIIERKAVELILSHAKFKDVPFEFESNEAEALAQSAGGGDEPESDIPDAEYDPEAKPLREAASHD
jgi:trigger factor